MSPRAKLLVVALAGLNALLLFIWILRPRTREDRARELRAEKLQPHFEELKVRETPWVDPDPRRPLERRHEPGATFKEYVSWDPPRPVARRSAIDLQPLGDFTAEQRKLIELAAEFLRRVSKIEVRVRGPQPLPEVTRRMNGGRAQVLAPELEEKLATRVAGDSLGLMAVLAVGLYPRPSWNYLFYDVDAQVAVASLQELGDPAASPAAFRLALARTLKIELQQLLSLLSIPRCYAYECMNNPSDGLEDLDRQPLHLCPACLQKLCWNLSCDPQQMLQSAAAFLSENGL